MPVYVMTCEQCGRTFERVATIANRPTTMACENSDCPGTAYRNLELEHGGFIDTPGNWPLKSKAAGVAKKQIAEAAAYDARMGVPTEYDARGNAIFTSRSHRKKWCEVHGYVDVDGGYGDYTGR
jgi:hypothetical protein